MRQSIRVWAVALAAAGLVAGVDLRAQDEVEGAHAVLPWAYVLNDPAASTEAPDPDELVTVPGSSVSMPRSAINIDNGPPDWHPDGHPRMPDVVAYGGREGVVACGYCHLPNGQGKPENAGLAGQPYEYLVQQMTDWRNGRRRPGEPRMGPPSFMERIGLATSDEEARVAAQYFSSMDFQPWVRVVETDSVPRTRFAGWIHEVVEGGGAEPIGARVVEFLRGCPGDRPFCLSVSFNAPHARDGDPQHYYPPDAESRLYEDREIPRPATSDPAFFEALPRFLRENESRKRWHTRWDTEHNFQRTVKGYWRMISGVDRMVGRFVDELQRLGVADNTIIMYTSDHGFLIGERGHSDCWLLYDNSMRVPLVVYDPRADAGQRGVRLEQMALNIDLGPTMLELAGLPVPEVAQGRSLLPLLRGDPVAWRDDFFCEHLFTTPTVIIPRCEGVRSRDWKYIRYLDQDPLYEELYHLESDPDEARNLRSDRAFAGDLERLRARCDELLGLAQGAAG